jgi:hypothetical protein
VGKACLRAAGEAKLGYSLWPVADWAVADCCSCFSIILLFGGPGADLARGKIVYFRFIVFSRTRTGLHIIVLNVEEES